MTDDTFFGDSNRPLIDQTVTKLIDGMAHDGFQNPIVRDEIIWEECFKKAQISVGFYNLDDNISHYKEIAHIGFWIARLKPFRIRNPLTFAEMLKNMGAATADVLTYYKGALEQREVIERDLDFQVNEYLAYFLTTTLIVTCQLDGIRKKTDEESKRDLRERLERAEDRAKTIQTDMIRSMRYHNYSARGFAMMFESLMKVSDI